MGISACRFKDVAEGCGWADATIVRPSIALGVMVGLAPAIRDLPRGSKNVDGRDKPGHDESAAEFPQRKQAPFHCAWGCFRRL
ncbi:hypothetical protein CVM73_29110 [Bradyrhizobium forestalis]|uniref:Uncharacterized protein n=1 Tax=Bradyrhizobium forestalis TaxID=1419263 RepID=A0A2M8R1Q3_9BRAD|nr:hypothetical protein CVM73_29110 [Bradyrhizobium forestalis]